MARIPEMPVPPPLPTQLARVTPTIIPQRTHIAADLRASRQSSGTLRWTIIASLLLAPFAILFAVAFPDRSPTDPDAASAYYAASRFVEASLLAPGTAEFGHNDESAWFDGSAWHVSDYVDSQNGFGALVRSDWTCELKKRGDKWRCRSLVINGRRVI